MDGAGASGGGASCIIARWEGGDRISYSELESYLDVFVKGGVTTEAQREEFYGSIRKPDEGRGGAGDLRSIRAFDEGLSMMVVLRGREASLPRGPRPVTPQIRSYPDGRVVPQLSVHPSRA
ncbi:MAG: hypothetical protein JRN59_07140 [Nitrososphaerota archaeon]|nr:hypothetical protein [Nitrososphaerota archaeon]